jgi:hypothetical protein
MEYKTKVVNDEALIMFIAEPGNKDDQKFLQILCRTEHDGGFVKNPGSEEISWAKVNLSSKKPA